MLVYECKYSYGGWFTEILVTVNIRLKKSCLLNIHEELEGKEVMNMNKSNLLGFLCTETGRRSVLQFSCSSVFSTYNDVHL